VEQVLRHARLAGQRISHLYGLPIALAVGPRPADEALRTLAELSPEGRYPVTLLARAWLTAMLGRFDEAWQLADEAADRYRDVLADDLEAWPLAEIATLAGDHDRAAALLGELNRRLEERGEISYLSTYAPLLGRSLCALGRHDEAEPLAARGRELGTEQDVMTQALWRQVQALIHASRGQHTDAEALAREAVAITQQTDNLNLQGDALCDLGEVLTAAGRDDEVATTLTAALHRYQRKRNQPAARRVHERLAALQPGANSATLAPNEQTSRS
ncbi:MAG: tetratricopeptide repeat protein, partial [Gaiellaceae bacterium]